MAKFGERRPIVGYAAMTCTVFLWASFALSIRAIGSSSLTSYDAALIRFSVPILVLSPWLGRALVALREQRMLVMLAIGCGAGLPFFLISALGGRLTGAALVGLVIPGTVPVFVALLGFGLWRLRIRGRQVAALASIVAGVGFIVVASADRSVGRGIVVLLLAGLMWSVYTLALRRSTLDPIATALALCLPSVLLVVPLMLAGIVPSHLLDGTAAGHDIALFALVQGVGVGVGSTMFYTVAVRTLGGATAATFGAISPVLTAIVAVPLFGEQMTLDSFASLALIVVGVIAFNRQGTSNRSLGTVRMKEILAADPS